MSWVKWQKVEVSLYDTGSWQTWPFLWSVFIEAETGGCKLLIQNMAAQWGHTLAYTLSCSFTQKCLTVQLGPMWPQFTKAFEIPSNSPFLPRIPKQDLNINNHKERNFLGLTRCEHVYSPIASQIAWLWKSLHCITTCGSTAMIFQKRVVFLQVNLFLWINPIPGMLSISIQVMLIGLPGIETLESYEGLACPSWSLTWNLYLLPCHVMHHQSQGVWHPELTPFLIKGDETTFQKRSLMRNSVHPYQKNSVKSPELLLYRTLPLLMNPEPVRWSQTTSQGFLMWYCVQIMSSSLDPSIWYPSQARSGDETRSFGLLCRLLAYPLCLLNENSLLISELNPNIWNPTQAYKARMSLNSYLKTPCDASSQSYPDARYCNILLQQEPNT